MIDKNLPKALILDETRLRQILINLIGNAIKFTDQGYIKISANYYSTEVQHSTVDLMFSVKDTGIGISKDQQPLVFGAFNQVVGQKYSKFGGTGLGLTITKKLIEMMGGEISIESEQGKGTTFKIILKNIEVASVESLETEETALMDYSLVEFEKRTILIADDIEFNRELIKGFLNEYELVLMEAKNGKEVFTQIKPNKPDLILLDMKMPEMNGFEVLDVLKKDENLKDIPVVAVTASVMKEDEVAVRNICDAYLRKPINRSGLINQIMKFIPHKLKEAASVASSAEKVDIESLTIDNIKQHHQIYEILKSKREKIEDLLNNMPITEIINFANDMKEISKQYDYQIFAQWNDNLIKTTEAFDIEEVEKLLKLLRDCSKTT